MWSAFGVTSLEVTIACLLVLWLLYKYCTSNYTYWKERSVPYVEPQFPFGTEKNIFFRKVPSGEHFQIIYNKFKNAKFVGGYQINKPYLLLRDPELIKNIKVKDFHNFIDRGLIDPELMTPVNRTLFIIRGEKWRNMRAKLSPAFTLGKMKIMFHLMEACAEELKKALDSVADRDEKIDVKDTMARFTTDVISSCAFGLKSNSIRNPDSKFRQNGKKIFQRPPLLLYIRQLLAFSMPKICKLLRLKQIGKESDDFFKKIVKDTVEYRETKGVVRNDFIDLLIKIKHNKCLSDDDKYEEGTDKIIGHTEAGLTLDEMTAQALAFFGAGFETAASTMTFCLYELSLNQDIQESLRKEIDDILQRHCNKITYQALQEMPYLDAVINETLRRYASLPLLNRQCTEDYKLPDSNLIIPKGMSVVIPVYAIHHDPEFYPEPFKFSPERFLNDATKTKNNFSFLPFGEGPRMCIGNRFGLLQMKTCMSMLIKNFNISLTEDTLVPVRIDKELFVTTPETPIILKLSKRLYK